MIGRRFRIFQMPLVGWLFIPGVTLRSPLAISLSFASAFVLSERAAVALSGALKPPSIPPKGGRTILRMVVMGLVIISISEADLEAVELHHTGRCAPSVWC